MHLNDLREMDIKELAKVAEEFGIENFFRDEETRGYLLDLKAKAKNKEDIFAGGRWRYCPTALDFCGLPVTTTSPGPTISM